MNSLHSTVHLAILGITGLSAANAMAANIAFDNSAGTLEWTTPTNWTTDALPGAVDTADFRDGPLTGTGPFEVTVASPVGPIQTLRFGIGTATAPAANVLTKNVSLSGASITLTGLGAGTSGLVYNGNSSASVTINNNVILGGDLDAAVAAPVSGTNFLTINGVVSESGGSRVFRKTQDGRLVLTNAANSFTGGVLVQNGTLGFASLGALGTGTTVSLGNATNTANVAGTLQYTGLTDATLGRSIVTLTGTGTGGGVVESNTAGVTLTLAACETISGAGRFNFGGTGNVVVNSPITISTGNIVVKTGSGNGQLSNPANSYTGATIVRNGVLTVTSTGALGNTSGITLGDGTSTAAASPTLVTGGAVTVGKALTVNAVANGTGVTTLGGAVTQSADSSTFSGGVTLNRDVRLTSSTDAAHAVSFTGNITDGAATFGVTKVGGGTVILGGSNDYDGLTTVSEGRLLVNGTQSGAAAAFSVANGATLGGTGTIAGTIVADSGSTLDPGVTVGTLTAGDTTLNGGLAVHVNGTGAGLANVLATKSLVLGSTASINFSVANTLDDVAYVFATYTSLDRTAFNSANVTGVPSGYAVDFQYDGANQIALVSVPEPTSMGLVVAAAFAVTRRLRKAPIPQA